MSSPILPTNGPSGPSTLAPPASSGGEDIRAFVSELAASETTFALAASRGGPSPELLDQIAAAGTIAERLRASGYELRFTPAERGGHTRIEIHDREGNAIRTVSTAEALEMAAGKPLE